MSDPANSGYECCGPMRPMHFPELTDAIAAWLCDGCLKFRHGLPWGHPLRPRVVAIMQPLTMQLYRERKAVRDAR